MAYFKEDIFLLPLQRKLYFLQNNGLSCQGNILTAFETIINILIFLKFIRYSGTQDVYFSSNNSIIILSSISIQLFSI